MRRLSVLSIGCFLCLFLALVCTPNGAFAADTTPTTDVTVTPTVTVTATVVVEGGAAGLDEGSPREDIGDRTLVLMLAFLVLVGLIAILLITETTDVQKRAYTVIEKFGLRKVPFRLDYVQTFSQPGQERLNSFRNNADELQDLKVDIKIPATVIVGEPATATLTVTGAEGITANWASSDQAVLAVEPDEKTLAAKLSALKVGTITLTVTLNAGETPILAQTYTIEAIEKPEAAGSSATIPFVGKGQYTVVIVLVLAALILMLGVLDIVTGTNLAILVSTLLGAILGVTVSGIAGGTGGDSGK
jgi:hypothetical protein